MNTSQLIIIDDETINPAFIETYKKAPIKIMPYPFGFKEFDGWTEISFSSGDKVLVHRTPKQLTSILKTVIGIQETKIGSIIESELKKKNSALDNSSPLFDDWDKDIEYYEGNITGCSSEKELIESLHRIQQSVDRARRIKDAEDKEREHEKKVQERLSRENGSTQKSTKNKPKMKYSLTRERRLFKLEQKIEDLRQEVIRIRLEK